MELFNYQKQGVEFLISHKGGFLLDEQGLGKTLQSIEATNQLPVKFVLVVCPAIMRGTWKKELELYSKKKHFVESYEYYTKHIKDILKDIKEETAVIVDESHYIKSPTSKRTKTILTLLRHINVTAKILLTGTPVTRDIDDLYTQLSVFFGNDNFYYKNIWQFRKSLMKCIHNYFGDKYTGFKDDSARVMVNAMLKQCSLRRTKSKVNLELPPVIRKQIFVDINKKIAKESLKYVDIATQMITGDNSYKELKERIDEESTHIASIRKALGVAKVPAIVDFVDMQIEANIKKIIVFCIHNDVVDMIEKVLQEKHKDYKIHVIKGSTTNTKRQQIIKEFQEVDKPQIIVANIVASGVGITLTKSHTIIFGELDWTPANMMQAEARVHRITQTEKVNSYFIIANESLDSRIVSILFNKINLIKETLK